MDWRRNVDGVLVAAAAFAVAGTVTALWPNPLFVRMTPAGATEVALLALGAVLMGMFTAVRRPFCSSRAAGTGGLMNFLGIACPVCNKLLVLVFGTPLLMGYYEPVRLYVAAAGIVLLAAAVTREIVHRRGERRLGSTVAT